MTANLLTYRQLAEVLGLAPGTVRNIWRTYPFIWLTPVPGKEPNLRGVRFDPDAVIAYLTELSTKENIYGFPHQKRETSSVLQVSGPSVLQNRQHQTRGEGLGGSKTRGTETRCDAHP